MAGKVDPQAAFAIMKAAGITPLVPYPGRNADPWRCRCDSCGAIVTPSYANVRKGQRGCRHCGNAASAIARRVDSAQAAAEMLEAGLEPLEDYANARARWRCRCTGCDRIVTPTLANIRKGQGGCRHCGNKAVGAARMAAGEPQALADMHAAGLTPLDPYPGVIAPWRSRCNHCAALVAPTVNSIRTGISSGCRHCGMTAMGVRKITAGADAAVSDMQAAGLEPLEPYPGATRTWRCRCINCMNIVTPRLHDIRAGRSGCAPCGYARWAATRLSIGADQARTDMLTAGLEPLDPYPGARKPWRSRCTRCHNVVTPTLGSIRYLGTSCRFCAPFGIDLAAPTLLYVLNHPSARAVKIGITGLTTKYDRLAAFERDGWQVHRTQRFETGADAFAVEQDVLQRLRDDLAIPPFMSPQDMPHGGATETANADLISATNLWTLTQQATQHSSVTQ